LEAAKSSPHRDETLRMQRGIGGAANMAMAAPAAAPPPAAIEAAAAAEEATQIAFTAPNKVSVAAGQSLVLPLLDREFFISPRATGSTRWRQSN
jgi:hypothetical protein